MIHRFIQVSLEGYFNGKAFFSFPDLVKNLLNDLFRQCIILQNSIGIGMQSPEMGFESLFKYFVMAYR
ncbi:MAG: hypothetical protein QM731_12480 [Chitinophagaceae bacterium]